MSYPTNPNPFTSSAYPQHIVVRITTKDEYRLFRAYPLESHYHIDVMPKLPMYVRISLDKAKILSRQTGVFEAGDEYIATYNSGISIEEFLDITDVSKPSMEYW